MVRGVFALLMVPGLDWKPWHVSEKSITLGKSTLDRMKKGIALIILT